jgi:hypothetical protein
MKIALSLLAAALVVGCSTVHRLDRASMTEFRMVDAGSWTMTVDTGVNYPPDSEKAEAIRLQWIGEHTAANGCVGYEVATRQFTKATNIAAASAGSLTYTGRCTR